MMISFPQFGLFPIVLATGMVINKYMCYRREVLWVRGSVGSFHFQNMMYQFHHNVRLMTTAIRSRTIRHAGPQDTAHTRPSRTLEPHAVCESWASWGKLSYLSFCIHWRWAEIGRKLQA